MLLRTTISLALAFAPAPLLAQAFVQPLGITDADRLAEQVRRLGANPRDVDALLSAAELSVRLDDLSAAGSFLARADRVAPASARGLAIKAALLVRSERPGEALRLFAQAEAMGFSPARFAADRGLAYDLIGEQRRAQAEYRVALRGEGAGDEVRRRLALSLGIAGKQREALTELDPLVRRNDRAAWRARAFILAMGGSTTEALGIAQTMMPPGSAQGLQGFFAELPRLPATDRAFAVHFGQVRATPQRLADARLAPPMAALPPEPVQVAAVRAAPPPAPARERGRRGKPKVGRVALPEAPAPVQVAAVEALPPPPAYRAPVYQPPVRTATPAAAVSDRPLTPGEQASLAAATLRPARPRTQTAAPAAERAGLAVAARPNPPVERPVTLAAALPPVRTPAPAAVVARPPVSQSSVSAASPASVVATPAVAPVVAGAAVTAPPPAVTAPAALSITPAAPSEASPTSSDNPQVAASLAPPVSATSVPPLVVAGTNAATSPIVTAAASTVTPEIAAPVSGPELATPAAATGLASAPLMTPAAEAPTVALAPAPVEAASLASPDASPPAEVATVAPAAPAPGRVEVASAPVLRSVAPAPARPRVSAAKADDILAKIVANLSIPASELGIDKPASGARPSRAAERLAAAKKKSDPATPADAPVALAAKDKRIADKRALADRKAAADKKALAERKELADKEAAERKAERSQPARIWVQVAGGANEGDLAKAWRSVKAKAPAALAGKQGYTTPLRATNRVLTGPFKTEAEARAHVNQLAKSGVSAFSFRSEAGQKISRLDAK